MLRLLLPLTLAACAATEAPEPAPSPTTSPATVPAAPTSTPSSAASPAAEERLALSVDGEGLRFVYPNGRTVPLAFGTPQAQAITATTAALGDPKARGTNADCPGGPVQFARWASGFTLHFRDDALVGWTGAPGVTTMAGIGVGSTRRELEDVLAIQVEKTGLGTQFTAGGLTGTLASDTPDAKIEAMWAGEGCVAN
jgi:hypothetical protein